MIGLGIATLILTPYVRVAASLVFFAFVERNGKYACFTAFVLIVLTYSLFLRPKGHTIAGRAARCGSLHGQ